MYTAESAVNKRHCNIICSSKSPETGLPVGFQGIEPFNWRYKNSVKPGRLVLLFAELFEVSQLGLLVWSL